MFVPGGFGQRVGSDMSMSHIFPQGVLAAFTLGGSDAEIEGLEPAPSVSWALSSVQCGQHQPAGTEAQRVRSKLAPSPPCDCSFPSQHLHPHLSRGQCRSKEVGAWCGVGAVVVPVPSRTLARSPYAAFASTSNGCPCPIQMHSCSARLRPAQPCPLLGRCSTSLSVKLCC